MESYFPSEFDEKNIRTKRMHVEQYLPVIDGAGVGSMRGVSANVLTTSVYREDMREDQKRQNNCFDDYPMIFARSIIHKASDELRRFVSTRTTTLTTGMETHPLTWHH